MPAHTAACKDVVQGMTHWVSVINGKKPNKRIVAATGI
jgi:hypothetical protein